MSRLAAWRRRLDERLWSTSEVGSRGFGLDFIQRWLQILERSIVNYFAHRGPSAASALTYTSLLTLVPLLAIVLPMLKGFDLHEHAKVALINLIDSNLPAETAAEDPLRLKLVDFINNVFMIVNDTKLSGLGYLGVAGLVLAVMSLMTKIEQAMNAAWSIHRTRPLNKKILDYMNLFVIFFLMIIALSTTATGSVIQFRGAWDAMGFNYLQASLLRLLPQLIVWASFIMIYHFMPNTRVRWTSAIFGGLIAGTLFQLMQLIIMRTHILVGRYGQIYGTFAILVIVLVLVYFSWSIVLWGAEVCSAHQNLRDWRRRRRTWLNTPAERETLALRLAALLAGPMLGHRAARGDTGDLADELMLPTAPVVEMIELFQQAGLAVQAAEEGTWLLARAPESLTALDVMRLARTGSLELQRSSDENGRDPLRALSPQLAEPLRAMTISTLADRPLDTIHTFQI